MALWKDASQMGAEEKRSVILRVPVEDRKAWARGSGARFCPSSPCRDKGAGTCIYASHMSGVYLDKAYNELREHALDAAAGDAIEAEFLPVPAPHEHKDVVEALAAAPAPAPAPAADIGAAIGNVFAGIIKDQLGNELAKVRTEMSDLAKSVGQYRGVEVRYPDGSRKKIEGIQHAIFDDAMEALDMGANILLVGPAGCGKSYLAKKLAEARKQDFRCTSLSGGSSESVLLGRLLPIGEHGKFVWLSAAFIEAYEKGYLFCGDEMDAVGDPSVLLSLNNALANGELDLQIRWDDRLVKQHKEFRYVGTMNTIGQGGDRIYVARTQLDGSTLDRFLMYEMDYDANLEERLVHPKVLAWGRKVRKAISDTKVRRFLSTRMMGMLSPFVDKGAPISKIARIYFTPWATDERSKIPAELRGD